VPDGGHSYDEPGVLDALIRATDKFGVHQQTTGMM
jgi:hypothetical protein